MAKRTEQGQRDQDIYHGVLGYLSEDAQAVLFKYLPYMEDRVNDEVIQFGRQLANDLRAAVKSESCRARKRLKKAKKGVERFECFAKKGKARLSDRQLPIEQVAQAASALNRMVCEGTALLGCLQTFAKRVAQYAIQRTPEGLRFAADDLERAHHVWCAEVAHVDKAICVAKQADATQQDATQADATQKDAAQTDAPQEDATQKDAELGQIKSLIAILKSRVRSLGGSARAQPYAEKEVPSRPEGDERTSGDNAPSPATEAKGAAASAEAEAGLAAQEAATANAAKADAAARAAAKADVAARAEETAATAEEAAERAEENAARTEEAARAAAQDEAAARAAAEAEAAAHAAAEAAEMPESASEEVKAAPSDAAEARAIASAAKEEALRAAARLEVAESAAEAACAKASAAKDEEAKKTAAAEEAATAWAAAVTAVAAELTELTWKLPALLERVQQQRTSALAEAAKELQEQAAAAMKVMSEWPSELDRLQSCAEEIGQAAKDLPDDFASALKACIERASLDVRGR